MIHQLNPNISTDSVLFAHESNKLKVLLVERENIFSEDFKESMHDLKLPGGLVYNDELLKDAAQRILKEQAGLEGIILEQFDVLDSLERMDNQIDRKWLSQTSGLVIDRVISVAFYGIVKMENIKYQPMSNQAHWVEIAQTRKLPFDHNEIINRALQVVRNKLKKEALVFRLLPEKFTISELQTTLQLFYNNHLDSRNFRKKIKKFDYIVPLAEKQHNVAHKPAGLYKFDKKRFEKFTNNRITF